MTVVEKIKLVKHISDTIWKGYDFFEINSILSSFKINSIRYKDYKNSANGDKSALDYQLIHLEEKTLASMCIKLGISTEKNLKLFYQSPSLPRVWKKAQVAKLPLEQDQKKKI